ncbi:hypothetical protein M8R20_06585 [Pseudomonas sp. R2.Fl]|nr:hypothetical protein [Pseudomonas sp. R2.Fl]
MRWLTIATVFLWSSAALADGFPAERVLSSASGDWNRDGKQDLALLVAPDSDEDDLSLYLYLMDADHPLLRFAVASHNIAWGNRNLDGMFGQDATIEALANGSIAVHSENSSIGRNRWQQTLTIAWRDGRFVAAGLTYSDYDTLNPDAASSCDYNILTGKLMLDGEEHDIAPQALPIEDWFDSGASGMCELG